MAAWPGPRLPESRPQLGVHRPAGARDDLGQRLDVRARVWKFTMQARST